MPFPTSPPPQVNLYAESRRLAADETEVVAASDLPVGEQCIAVGTEVLLGMALPAPAERR